MTSLHEQSVARMATLKRGDPVTNVCAGKDNPSRHCCFVAYETISRRNKYGIVHMDHWAKCRAGGRTFRVGIDVIHPGHLDTEACAKLFAPVWEERCATPKGGAA